MVEYTMIEYPQDAIAWLVDKLGIKPGRQVVDLAAGTGAVTELLADVGADIVAVEPVASMRDRLHARLPAAAVLGGVAEALPLADKSVDVVVVARAFRWFDARPAMDEIARVVRPGGGLGLIWTGREHTVEWADQVWSVIDGAKRADSCDGHASYWSPWTEAAFNHLRRGLPGQVSAMRVYAMYAERLG